MTVLDIITAALRLIGVLTPGRTAGPSETAVGLQILNRMLKRWNNERLLVFSIPRALHNLVAGTPSYMIGPNGDWNTDRPVRIARAGYVDASGGEIPIEVFTTDKWASIRYKSQPGTPEGIHYDPTVPLGTIYPWPVPDAGAKLALYPWQKLGSFANTEATVEFPDGYEDAIIYNLAVQFAPEWSRQIRQDVLMQAREFKAAIKRTNIQPLEMRCDAALLSNRYSFDISRGE